MSHYNTPRDETIDGENIDSLRRLLIGRRIIDADEDNDTLTLDDGTKLIIDPNWGGCTCGSGDYWLSHLTHFDNIITNVDIKYEAEHEEYGDEKIHIFVFAESEIKDNIITVEGNPGNGWYGRGFEILVQNPKKDEYTERQSQHTT